MQNVHPIFQQALAGIAPPADAKHWQAMCIQLRTELTQYDAPKPPKGQFAYTFQHPELGALECHLEHEPAAPECGWFESAALCAAYLRGVDIFDRLEQKEIDAIEIDVAKKARERYFDAAGEE